MSGKTDILIIGAGITGCALARELSRYNADIVVLERGSDIAEGATKANSGIVHAGYDAVPGTKKALYNVRGAAIYPQLCASLGLPYLRCGALVIALAPDECVRIEELKERGERNGVAGLRVLDRQQLLSLEPNLNPDVICGLSIPGSAIISPYETAFALADDAALNGVSFRLNQEVISVFQTEDHGFSVQTRDDTWTCRVLVNCAGASGAEIHNMLSPSKLKMIHRRGQYYLLDRSAVLPFSRTVFQCPSVMGKGVLVSPTVHGNLLIGPTAEDIDDPLDTATTSDGLADILAKASRTWPRISVKNNITNFSGIRAHLSTDDFVIGPCPDCSGFFEAIGIESPGLSSAPAIAEDLALSVSSFLNLSAKEKIVPFPISPRPFREMSETERERAVRDNPAYGNIICRCEMITEAEIRQAIRRPVGAGSVDAVKRRTRAGMGRCQGGFCLPRVAAILAEETGVSVLDVTKNGGKSYLLSDTIDSFLKEETGHA